MRQIILQGLEQVYSKLFHMIAEFLPRFLVMLIIVLIGLLVALVLRSILGGVLGLTKLDRVAEQSGASRVLRMAHLPSHERAAQPLHFLGHLACLSLG